MLRKLIKEENNLKSFLKKYTILDTIYKSASAWQILRIFKETITAAELAKTAVDAKNINSWFECDNNLPAFEQKSNEDIVI